MKPRIYLLSMVLIGVAILLFLSVQQWTIIPESRRNNPVEQSPCNCVRSLDSNLKSSVQDKQPLHSGIKSAVRENPFTPRSYTPNKETYQNITYVMVDLNRRQVKQDDPDLISVIRNYYIDQPSDQPYNLTIPDRLEFSWGQAAFVDSRLNYMEGGFYVESGALNGEKGSNTLFFEKVRKWNGLLVEPNPSNYAMLKSKHRKAFSIHACIYPGQHPKKVRFWNAFNVGKIVKSENEESKFGKKNVADVQCFPFYSILLALNQTTVDFFSLDVEGDELGILKSIPFDKINIKMLTVEYAHGGGSRFLEVFMKSKGYETMLNMMRSDGGVADLIFRKIGLKH